MKRITAVIAVCAMALITACGSSGDASKKSEGVMTYAEYAAAAVDAPVTIETFVQAKQSWWDNKATLYTQDPDGAYFIYNSDCSQELYDKLTPGTKIKVTGYKGEWSGEVEVAEGASIEIEDGKYIAKAFDATSLLGTDDLIKHQNEYVVFKNATVADKGDGKAFLYNWDGSGSQGDDLYFDVEVNGSTYSFTVESYLCGADTEVYKAVEGLSVGDKIDAEGFLYWYEGPNPHITKITKK